MNTIPAFITFVFAAFVVLALWNWSLKKNVAVRTKELNDALQNLREAKENLRQLYEESLQASEEIARLAFYDPLTKLPNRRLMLDRLEHTMKACASHERQGALLLIDLDNFKTLNDTQGHDVGDQLLQEVANRLAACVGEGDTVARLGGDEFVVILEDLHRGQEGVLQATDTARIILTQLAESHALEVIGSSGNAVNFSHQCTSSIGVALFCDLTIRTDELMKRADTAMYQAKSSGRNTLCFFDPAMQAAVNNRAEMEISLRKAIVEEQFVLHYQPQINHKGKLTGVEALIRWEHPERGMISPLDFIPLAEETGLILPIGHWVLRTVCQLLAEWSQNEGTRHLTVAVNVSARQFRLFNMVEETLAVIQGTGAPANRLKLEITESLLLENTEEIISKMNTLKAHGVTFSLDDFGTGYSSLSYLKRLPLDQLKIDKSFVQDILTDTNDASISRTVVALGDSLGLNVIAEGVEALDQRDFLSAIGCQSYQGYYFSRPLNINALTSFLWTNYDQHRQAT